MPNKGFRNEQVIPLAFHVDYWDYLGWPDRFAQSNFTKRQRRIASHNRSRTIYTPQLVLQGRDFRRHSRLRQTVEQINQTPARAQITLKVASSSKTLNIVADAKVLEDALNRDARAFVAIYENHLQSDVKAGENAGRTLKHQFVVRKWIGPLSLDPQGKLRWSKSVDIDKDWKTKDVGVAVCILNTRNGDTLQAVALSLND